MATLRFNFGTMGSGKSTVALQIHHNLANRQLFGLLLTTNDREGRQVTSRLGVAAPAIEVAPECRPLRTRRGELAAALHRVRRSAVLLAGTVRGPRSCRRRPRGRRVRVRPAHRLPGRAVRRHEADARTRRRAPAAPGRGSLLVRRSGHPQRPSRERRRRVRGRHRGGRRHPGVAGQPLFGDSVRYELLCRSHFRTGELGD